MIFADSSQELLNALFTTSADGLALIDTMGRFLRTNEPFATLFGREVAQLSETTCHELFSTTPQDQPLRQIILPALEHLAALPHQEFEWLVQRRNHIIAASITPIASAQPPYSLLVLRDITAAHDVIQMKASMLSTITHELRAPLNTINGYLDLTLDGIGGDLNEQQQEFIQRARAGSEHLSSLIEDMLFISRADAGQLRLTREMVSLADLVTDAVEDMALNATDNNLTIAVELAPALPRFYADSTRLRQVVRNLLSNAIRFTPPQGQITITGRLAPADSSANPPGEQEVIIEVSDTGSGIAPEYQQRIFERFFQVSDGSRGRASGQGLGLAVANMIMDLHGGSIQVQSIPGQGSRFTCILPYRTG